MSIHLHFIILLPAHEVSFVTSVTVHLSSSENCLFSKMRKQAFIVSRDNVFARLPNQTPTGPSGATAARKRWSKATPRSATLTSPLNPSCWYSSSLVSTGAASFLCGIASRQPGQCPPPRWERKGRQGGTKLFVRPELVFDRIRGKFFEPFRRELSKGNEISHLLNASFASRAEFNGFQ